MLHTYKRYDNEICEGLHDIRKQHAYKLERTASCCNTATAYNTHHSKAVDIEVYLDNVLVLR